MNIKLIVALGFLLTSIFIGWCCYDYGYTQARTQQIDNYESMIRELKAESDQALERERESYKKQEQLETKYLEKIKELQHNETTLINEYHANNLRLRDSLKPSNVPMCPALPTAPAAIMQPQQADFTTEMSSFLFGMPQEQTP